MEPSSAAVTVVTRGPRGGVVVDVACVVEAVDELVAGVVGPDAHDATNSAAARRTGTERDDMAGAYVRTESPRVTPRRQIGISAAVALLSANGMLVPVMCFEASQARNSTSSATSSGSSHGDGSAWYASDASRKSGHPTDEPAELP